MKSDKKKDSENLRKKALRQRTSLETKKEEARYIYPSPDLVEMLWKQVRELEKLCEQIHLWKTDKYGMNRAGLDEFGGNR
tara:strand:+ start:176 stop:415 length:240 start_codon:yes stop_codon:yes gene_type:complete